jgi:putative peptide zinc metalloprotease protein
MPAFSSATRLPVRQRTDLQFYPQSGRDGRVWVVKDPLSLTYFQLRDDEYQVLRWLDGRCDPDELISRFERRFAPRRLTRTRLMAFITKLHRAGLVLSETVGQGDRLRDRRGRRRLRTIVFAAANPLAIRLPGVDPTVFLDWLLPKTRWLFSPRLLSICGWFIALVSAWVVLDWERISARFPDGHLMLRPANVALLGVVLMVTKALHELGHAMACRYHGAECHRIGVMLLVFTPCLYCDVSDAWTLEQRWKRIAITSAGILVELFLAAVCTVLWWFSQPGIVHSVLFNVVLVCSLGTVLLNGNPLMRYDGYYLLSDLLRYPNLWQQSTQRLRDLVGKVCFGIPAAGRPESRRRSFGLIAYQALSLTYRAVLVATIVYLSYRILKPLGLEAVSFLLTASIVVGFTAGPAMSLWRIVVDPMQRRRIRGRHVLRFGVVAGTLLAVVCLIPLPCRVTAPMSLEAKDAKPIYVSVPGRLCEALPSGTPVREGDTLARLENLDLQRTLEDVRGQVFSQRQRIRNLQSLRSLRPDFADQLPTAEEVLKDLLARQSQLETEVAALELIAPLDGTVIEPPRQVEGFTDDGRLADWSGTPLDRRNRGALLQRQTLLCLVGPKAAFDAIAYVHQADVAEVREGQRVELSLRLGGWRTVHGRVRELSQARIEEVPRELAFDGRLANRQDAEGIARPDEVWYQARIELIDPETPLLVGARGTAKIRVDAKPLMVRLWRFLQRTFKPVT